MRYFEYYLLFVVCDETKQKKKKFFSSKEEAISHHFFFILFFLSGNVLKFAKINVGGWKQYTRDAYIKDLKPIKRSDDICYRYYCCCCLLKHEA